MAEKILEMVGTRTQPGALPWLGCCSFLGMLLMMDASVSQNLSMASSKSLYPVRVHCRRYLLQRMTYIVRSVKSQQSSFRTIEAWFYHTFNLAFSYHDKVYTILSGLVRGFPFASKTC